MDSPVLERMLPYPALPWWGLLILLAHLFTNPCVNHYKWYHFSHRRFSSLFTDANIDASCNRTLYDPNWVVCVDKPILTIYNWLLMMKNTRITPWITVQGKGSARTAPRFWFPTLLSKLFTRATWLLPLLPTVVRYQRGYFPSDYLSISLHSHLCIQNKADG